MTDSIFNNDILSVSISTDEIKVDPEKIETFLGYPKDQAPDFIKESITDIIKSSREYIQITAGYTIRPVVRGEDKSFLTIGNKAFNTGKIISAQMNRAEYAAFFLCTIGPDLENWVKKLSEEGEIMSSFIADHVASESVEKVVDVLNDKLKIDLESKGYGATYPFSPGYCGWHVSEQPMLFSFFPENPFGIKLSDSHLMIPMKSVSGIIGIGREAKQRVYPCKICTFKECYKNQQK